MPPTSTRIAHSSSLPKAEQRRKTACLSAMSDSCRFASVAALAQGAGWMSVWASRMGRGPGFSQIHLARNVVVGRALRQYRLLGPKDLLPVVIQSYHRVSRAIFSCPSAMIGSQGGEVPLLRVSERIPSSASPEGWSLLPWHQVLFSFQALVDGDAIGIPRRQ